MSSIPDVGLLELTPDVKLVVLASDGLWDVLSDQDACNIALKALQDFSQGKGGNPKGNLPNGADPAATYAADRLVQSSMEARWKMEKKTHNRPYDVLVNLALRGSCCGVVSSESLVVPSALIRCSSGV